MKHEHRIPMKVLSVLLAILMLTGAVSVGLTAFAAEDSYQALADALRADGMKGAKLSWSQSISPDVKNSQQNVDPMAYSAAYTRSAALWNAMEKFWAVAKNTRSGDKGDIVLGGEGDVRVLMRNDDAEIKAMVESMAETGRMSGGYFMGIGNSIVWNAHPEGVKRYLDYSNELAYRW